MKLFIFGAGASAGTLGLPAARDFGEELERARPDWRGRYPQLARVVDGLHRDGRAPGWDLGAAWTRLDYLTKLAWALGRGEDVQAANVEMRQALLDVYGRPGRRRWTRARGARTVRQLLRDARPGDVIVSFNYDVVVEQLAASMHVRLVQGPCEACGPRHRCVQLIKPHGSLSWIVSRDGRKAKVTWRGRDGAPLLRPMDARRVRIDRQPLVLGVVPIKSELLAELQEAHRAREVHESIVRQWRAAVEAARHADQIVVVGYSFPPEDQYGSFLFYEATRARRRKPAVGFFELEHSAPEVARRLVQVFGVWPTWREPV